MRRLICRLRGRHEWDPDPGDVVWACTTCDFTLDLADFGLDGYDPDDVEDPR